MVHDGVAAKWWFWGAVVAFALMLFTLCVHFHKLHTLARLMRNSTNAVTEIEMQPMPTDPSSGGFAVDTSRMGLGKTPLDRVVTVRNEEEVTDTLPPYCPPSPPLALPPPPPIGPSTRPPRVLVRTSGRNRSRSGGFPIVERGSLRLPVVQSSQSVRFA